jgi:hypothetical protein
VEENAHRMDQVMTNTPPTAHDGDALGALVERAKAGERDALEAVVHAIQHRIYNLALQTESESG